MSVSTDRALPGRWTARLLTFAVIAALVSVPTVQAGTNDWMSFQKDTLHLAKADGADLETPLKLGWRKALEGEIRASPVISGDTLYIGTMDGMFYALDKDSSRTRWSFDAGAPIRGTATIESDRIYFATFDISSTPSKGQLYVLQRKDGSIIAQKELDGASWGGPVVQAGKVFVGTESGSLIAYETEGFSQLWTFSTSQFGIAKGEVRTVPMLYENKVYFGSFNHFFFAVDAGGKAGTTTTTVSWMDKVGDIVYSSGVIDPNTMGGTAFLGSYDGQLYAFASGAKSNTTGCPHQDGRKDHPANAPCSAAIRYRYDAGASIAVAPTVANDRVFFGDLDGKFHSIQARYGRTNWIHDVGAPIRSSPAVVNHTIVFGADDGKLHVLKEAPNGLTLVSTSTFDLGGKVHSSPAISAGTVYIATQDGVLYAVLDAKKAPPEVKPDPKPDLMVDKVVSEPDPPVAGDPLKLNVTYKNLGEARAGTVTLRLYADDVLVDETNVTMTALSTMTHVFEVASFPGEATYRIVIDEGGFLDDADSSNHDLEVTLADPFGATVGGGSGQDDQAPTVNDASSEKKEDEDIPAPGVVTILGVLAAALVALRRRR
ncbi:MAG: PQQ-binding-like beta-propeller repeat protein [Euryarchaeota archaeon]|nr:PQQ-binding-like beta-propeller repeat protein [Euryarchaeota archaeon]